MIHIGQSHCKYVLGMMWLSVLISQLDQSSGATRHNPHILHHQDNHRPLRANRFRYWLLNLGMGFDDHLQRCKLYWRR